MAEKIVLKLNNTALDLTNEKYTESYKNVDSLSTSEAGTTLRAVVRTGIPTLSVSYKCIASEKALLDGFAKASSLSATKYDEVTSAAVNWSCFMSDYSADLIVETATDRFYKVSFKLNDLEN